MGVVDSEKTPKKGGDSSSGWRDRLEVFMNGGCCKDAYKEFKDCVDEPEKNKESIVDSMEKIDKCMTAHSNYYKPIIKAKEAAFEAGEEAAKEMIRHYQISNSLDGNDITKEQKDKLVFMKRGPCKESFSAWEAEVEAETNKEEYFTECERKLFKCVNVHFGYFYPVLAVKKAIGEHLEKELEALFS